MYKSKREEIEALGDQNLRRKRQQKAYNRMKEQARKEVEAEARAHQGPSQIPNGPLHMPKMLIFLIFVIWALGAAVLILSAALLGYPDQTAIVLLGSALGIPITLLWLYIGYLFTYLLYRVYWWFHLIMALFTVLGLVYGLVGAIYGYPVFVNSLEQLNETVQEWQNVRMRIEDVQSSQSADFQRLNDTLNELQQIELPAALDSNMQQLTLQLAQIQDIGLTELQNLNTQLDKLQGIADPQQLQTLRAQIDQLEALLTSLPSSP